MIDFWNIWKLQHLRGHSHSALSSFLKYNFVCRLKKIDSLKLSFMLALPQEFNMMKFSDLQKEKTHSFPFLKCTLEATCCWPGDTLKVFKKQVWVCTGLNFFYHITKEIIKCTEYHRVKSHPPPPSSSREVIVGDDSVHVCFIWVYFPWLYIWILKCQTCREEWVTRIKAMYFK